MGYWKTLMIDPSAAREYSQRWAQSDQVKERHSSHLANGHEVRYLMTTAMVSQPVNMVQGTQNDQVGSCNTHLVSGRGSSKRTTTTTTAASIPVAITREHVGRALREWRLNVQHNARDLNAVNRAALNLEACLWYMTPDGELVITSATDSRTRYHVTPDGCDCRAAANGRPCWHVAAYKILHTADAIRRVEASQKAAQQAMERIQVLVDELV